jgi:hypothetical protein
MQQKKKFQVYLRGSFVPREFVLGLGNIFSSSLALVRILKPKKNERIECMLWSENWNVEQ